MNARIRRYPRRTEGGEQVVVMSLDKPGPKPKAVSTALQAEIAHLYELGYSDFDIALDAGCSSRTVSRWRSRHEKPPHGTRSAVFAHGEG